MKISVVIPMYNASKSIIKALDSIKFQTYKADYQILIINDGSKDDSEAVVNQYILDNPRMNITLISQENSGVSMARNVGLRLASGDYIALLDSDDEWLPNKIEKQLMVFEDNPQVDVLATNRNEEHFDSFLGKRFSHITKINSRLLLLKNFLSPPTVMMKKTVIDEIGFFEESQKYAEEGNYWIRVCNKKNCYLLNESLVLTGDGKPSFGHSGLSGNMWEMEKGELQNIHLALRLKIVNYIEYILLSIYSILKYFRRLIIVRVRR